MPCRFLKPIGSGWRPLSLTRNRLFTIDPTTLVMDLVMHRTEIPTLLIMNNVTVATFNSVQPAEQLKEELQEAGIPAKVTDQHIFQRLWFLAKPYCSFHLDVQKDFHSQANALLIEWHARNHALSEAVRCPMCGSLRVEYPQMTRKFILPTLIAHLLTLLRITKHSLYCMECHNTWRLPNRTGSLPVKLPH